jgi:glutathione synthase/RimK-type ligase-like ATP-grasp enzyme
MKILPYKSGSASAKALAEGLGILRINREKTSPIRNQAIINWGCSGFNRPMINCHEVNSFEAVATAANKLKAFDAMNNGHTSLPNYTTDKAAAAEMMREHRWSIVERHTLTGHSGEGIRIVDNPAELSDDAKLYVRYIKKVREIRVHVMNGCVIFAQEKKRKVEVPDNEVNWQVRNLAGGFIYANQDIVLEEIEKNQAISAVQCLDLDFGAVDMIYNSKEDRWYVLEINTAPGLAGSTLAAYTEAFRNYE